MALSDELTKKFNLGDSVSDFQKALNSPLEDMKGLSSGLPDLSADFSQVSRLGGNLDLSNISNSLSALLTEISPALASLPAANQSLEPLNKVTALAEKLAEFDWRKTLETFGSDLEEEINSNSNFLSQLGELSRFLEGNASLESAKALLQSLSQLTGTNLNPDQLSLPGVMPAVESIAKLVGHLMAVWHQLDESNQLAGLIGKQLQADTIAAGVRQVSEQLQNTGHGSLKDLIEGLDVTDHTAVAEAKLALQSSVVPVLALRDAIAEGMGFGEATLLQLNPTKLSLTVKTASAELTGMDLTPFNTLVEGIGAALQPMFQIDLSQAPAETLDGWLTRIESSVGDMASRISAYEASTLAAPLTDGIEAVMALPEELTTVLQSVKLNMKKGLDAIESAVGAIPVETVANAIREVLGPISDALRFISDLVARITRVLGEAIGKLQLALNSADLAVEDAQKAIERVFQGAKHYIDSLALDQILGEVAEQVENFAELLLQADMSPYFDTVVDALDSTTDIVDKVPFAMLPDSMEQEVVNLVKPVKAVDVDTFNNDIKSLLQLGPDGQFALRPDLEAALTGIQQKFDEVLAVVRDADPTAPGGIVSTLTLELDKLREQMDELIPTVALDPVQNAIDDIKSVIGSFNLNETLAPINEGFTDILKTVDEYKPSVLLMPVEAKLLKLRDAIFGSLQLDVWEGHVQQLRTQVLALADPLDPSHLEPALHKLIAEVKAQSHSISTEELGYLIGSFVNSLLGGEGARANSFQTIVRWLISNEGASVLAALAKASSNAIEKAKGAVTEVDPHGIVLHLQPQLDLVNNAIKMLPEGPVKAELQSCAKGFEIENAIGGFAGHRERYLNGLTEASGCFTALANSGFSEVDIAVNSLRQAFTPLAFTRNFFMQLLGVIGISGFEKGLPEVINNTFDVATPQRLANIFTPLLTALKSRLAVFLDGFIDPVLAAITDLNALKAQLSIADLINEMDEIHRSVKQKVEAMNPSKLLGEVVNNFNTTQTTVMTFDPLIELNEGLTALRNSSATILAKLDIEQILKSPLEIYRELVALFESLDLSELLSPVLEVLDELSEKVSSGLDDTSTAFTRLQDALPDQVGGSSVSAAASVGI